MRRTISFKLDIEFSDSIYDDQEINEISENIATAIITEAENYGISPQVSDASMTSIAIFDVDDKALTYKTL